MILTSESSEFNGLVWLLARFTYGCWMWRGLVRERGEKEKEWDRNRHWIWGPMRSFRLDIKPSLLSLKGALCDFVSFRVAFASLSCPISSALLMMQMGSVRQTILRSKRTSVGFYFLHIHFPLLLSQIYFSIGTLSSAMDIEISCLAIYCVYLLHFDNLVMNPNL